jgi:hypothetical protein
MIAHKPGHVELRLVNVHWEFLGKMWNPVPASGSFVVREGILYKVGTVWHIDGMPPTVEVHKLGFSPPAKMVAHERRSKQKVLKT